ncbi:hypothetical protein L3Q82_006231 [Scortum barcoo]|uniref:Uncharacterized protein n=1 Tax=Scortum barcoo TaxID=214431 RepID=A0ACB8X2B3_9TELE|nr:hypothetical protein L3Q82_006231 [Scortum barcoo]
MKEARLLYNKREESNKRIMELEAEGARHIFIHVGEVGFNLCRVKRHGRNITGQKVIVTLPALLLVSANTRGELQSRIHHYWHVDLITGETLKVS